MKPVLEFVIPVPASSKNSRILTRDACGRPRSFPSRAARRSTEQIKSAAQEAIDKAKAAGDFEESEDGTLFGDDEVAVEVSHDVPTDTVKVRMWSLGPRVKGRSGRKRDVGNLDEALLDALQGPNLAYRNDNQVGVLLVKRAHWPTQWEDEDGEGGKADEADG